jgi:glycosyltransferase involved in cell wall biosynthesis
MDRQVQRALDERGVEYKRVYGSEMLKGATSIENGAFLDSEGTNYFKASQIQRIAEAFKAGRVEHDDVFFVSDLWFPGIEAIPYMAMFRGIRVHVWGVMHAGSWTDTDFVRALKSWARHIERGWLDMAAGVFVGSEFHRQDIIDKGRIADPTKIHATGLVFDTEDVLAYGKEKRDLVVFAGRLDDEKQPWLFDEMQRRIGNGVEFIKTYEQKLTKADYFDLLSQAKVIFSAALQENFGYAVLEACTLGATPVVPDRLAYTEMYPEQCRYKDMDEAEQMVRRFLKEPLDLRAVPRRYNNSVNRMLDIMLGETQ